MKTNSKVAKRIISLVLTLLMVLSLVPMSVFSTFAEELSELSNGLSELSATIDTGAEVTLLDADGDGYYDINTDNELYAFAALVNGGNTGLNAELIADIVVNAGQTPETARKWTPIGNNSNKYTGIFDGNNKAVSGLYFNNGEVSEVGLFGCVGENGTVKNTGVINSYFSGGDFVGGVVGYNDYGTIENCYNTGNVSGSSHCVGGVVGDNSHGTITNCYNTGNVSGYSRVGGVVGNNYYGTITNCYNTGKMGVIYSYVGGVVGENYMGTITNCYFLDTVCSGGIDGEDVEGSAEAKTAEQFASGEVAYLLGEAFGQNLDNEDYPVLGGDKVYQVENCIGESIYRNINENIDHNFENGICTVCGNAFEPATDVDNDGVYEIGNAGQLYWFADKVNNDNANFGSADAILTADIVVNEGTMTAESEGAIEWTPIGNNSNKYTGIFDGNNKAVSGLYFNNNATNYVGLFGYVGTNGTVKNTGVINSYFNGNWDVGGVAGYIDGGTLANCYNSSIITGKVDVGGVVGNLQNSISVNCHNTGAVSGITTIGGLFGYAQKCTAANCYNTGAIIGGVGSDIVGTGGLVGRNFDCTITNCYNTGTVKGSSRNVGGLAGYNKSTLTNCYNIGTVKGSSIQVGGLVGHNDGTLTNCYSTETVTGSTRYVGGLVGNNGGTITNCYYSDTAYTGGIGMRDSLAAEDIEGSAEAKTAEQFANGEVAYLLQGAQEELVWGQKIGTDERPILGGDKVYYGYVSCSDDSIAVYTNNSNVIAEKPAHEELRAEFTWDEPYDDECYVSMELYCAECGDYMDSDWGYATLKETVEAEDCMHDGSELYEITLVYNDVNYTGSKSFTLKSEKHTALDANGFCSACGGYEPATLNDNGTPDDEWDDYYEISNAGQLYWFAELAANDQYAKAVLTDDIVVNEDMNSENLREWIPIGESSSMPYCGSFDGQGHFISGLYAKSELNYIGLFGAIGWGAEISNLGIKDSFFEGNYYVGGIVGYNDFSKVTNCYADNVEIVAVSSGGALVGYNYGEVSNSYSTTDSLVDSNYATITNCYYLAEEETDYHDGTTAKTAEQFKSGEVAYLLQAGVVGEEIYDEELQEWVTLEPAEIWGQKIGTDTYPVFGGDKVYQVENCIGEPGYSNTDESGQHNYVNGFCTVCDAFEPATDVDNDGVYEIANAGQLYWFADKVNNDNANFSSANAILTADIVVNEGAMSAESTGARVWTPIGYNYNNSYIGTFDGNDHTVSGLYFNNSEAHFVGLFGYVGTNGAVKNTGVINSYFNGSYGVGGVAGANSGTIENCYNTGNVSGIYCVGGLLGYHYEGAIITNCYNEGEVSGSDYYVGGVVGDSYKGTIENCYNEGEVSCREDVGGVVGKSKESTIENCYNTGAVSGSDENVGGVVGNSYRDTITNCYNTGDVSGTGYIGGVASVNIYGTITNCYNTGTVSGSDDFVGGVVGEHFGTITNCYYLNTTYTGGIGISGTTDADDVAGSAEAKTAEQFASGEVAYLLQGTQEELVWGQNIGTEELPVLGGDKVYYGYETCDVNIGLVYTNTEVPFESPDHNFVNGFCTVCDAFEPATLNKAGVYEIGNAGQLYWFADKVNNDNANFGSADAILTADIVVNEGTMTAESEGAREWTPIGCFDSENYVFYKYTGTFDGNGHTVSGLYFNNSKAIFVGLFGYVGENGAVKSTGVINSYFSGDEFVGGVVGDNEGTITNCYNEGYVIGSFHYVGGVVGYNGYGTITNCYNTGKVSASEYVGGVVGYNSSNGTITNGYNTGEVSGNSYVGGVVGNNYGTIENCYNTGAVSGEWVVGGVVGDNNKGTITNSYNTGEVSGNSYVGGVVGRNHDTIKNCYYLDTAYTGGINGEDVAGSAEAKTAEQFASGEAAYLLQGTQEELVWGQKLGTEDYPVLGGDKVYGGYTYCGDEETVYTNNADELLAEKPAHSFVNGFCTVCGGYEPATLNEDGVYEIGNAGQLYWFAEYVNAGNTSANAILTADIVVNEGTMTAETEGAREWTPIGNNSNKYTGIFDGNNKAVSGLYFNNNETNYVGLFGYVGTNGTIKNTGVINSYFSGGTRVGGVAGVNYGLIENSYNASDVSGEGGVGGITGINYGTITNCYNTGTVSGNNYVGGVAGDNEGTITNCYNTGEVSGSQIVGGVAGYIGSNDTITNCYNAGAVNGSDLAGGIVGIVESGYVSDCYNTGTVTKSQSRAGGVAGYNYGIITNCYYLDIACSGGINGEDVVGSAEAKTSEQFASGEVAYLLGEAFGQKIGTDELPTLGGDKVYAVTKCNGEAVSYNNTKSETLDHNFENGFCTVCGAMDGIAQVKGYTISLGGNIAVNYYMVLSDEVLADENAEMVFTVPNGDSTYEVRIPVSSVTPDSKGYYMFTCEVAAKEMASKIAAQIVTSDSESDVFEYTVKQYAEYILEMAAKADPDGAVDYSSYVKAAPLVKAMLNYGANAQHYFNHNTDNLANATLDEAEKALVDNLDLSAYNVSVNGSEEGVTFYGGALSLKSETAIKLYFIIEEGTVIPEVTVNGEKAELKQNGNLYELKISDIPAHKLSEMFEVKVGNLTVGYGVFSYGHIAMNSGKEVLVNTIKALYAYNQKAVEYIG